MTDEQQEVESIRYSQWIKLVPLSSGRIAMLGPRCELYKIVDNWTEVLSNVDAMRTAYEYKAPVLPPSISIDVDL